MKHPKPGAAESDEGWFTVEAPVALEVNLLLCSILRHDTKIAHSMLVYKLHVKDCF